MSRFEVSKTVESNSGDSPATETQSGSVTATILNDTGAGTKHIYHIKGEGNGAERIPLCEKSQVSLALYEDEYNTQGQKIGQMLRSLSLYQTAPPKAEDVETASTQRASKQVTNLNDVLKRLF
jgi:hypothetical protein